jgi:hypothetical protein
MSAQPADIVSLAARRRADLGAVASGHVSAARAETGLDLAAFASRLGSLLTWQPTAEVVMRWEQDTIPPGDVVLACSAITHGEAGVPLPLLAAVPPAFPAAALAGPWVTVYDFAHAGKPHYHADIAWITAESGSRIRAVNHPPEPRSQGRRRPFRNEIEARLVGRHVVGEWQNRSDTRYCGGLQLAVLPGETVMQGTYSGVGSDIEVSSGAWKWVRLETADGLAEIILRDPAELHALVMSHSQPDVPLLLAEIREEF